MVCGRGERSGWLGPIGGLIVGGRWPARGDDFGGLAVGRLCGEIPRADRSARPRDVGPPSDRGASLPGEGRRHGVGGGVAAAPALFTRLPAPTETIAAPAATFPAPIIISRLDNPLLSPSLRCCIINLSFHPCGFSQF